MILKKSKYLYILFFLIFILSGLISFGLVVDSQPQLKLPVPTSQTEKAENKTLLIDKETVIDFYQEYQICVLHGLNCREKITVLNEGERESLNGLTLNELQKRYPPDEWKIIIRDNYLKIIKTRKGLCPNHKKIWHLGTDKKGEFLAIYYGPKEVGEDGGVYQITEIPLKKLPEEEQEKIQNNLLEYYNLEELVATLDSYSEFL